MSTPTGTLVNAGDSVQVQALASAAVAFSGTYAGGTVLFQASADGGRTWNNVLAWPSDGSAAAATTATLGANASAAYLLDTNGFTDVQVVAQGAMGGTVNVFINPSLRTVSRPSGSVTGVSSVTRGGLTDRSGTVASPNVSQQAAAANPSRSYLFIQNLSVNDLWVNFGASATAGGGSVNLAAAAQALKAGGSLTMENNFICTQAVNVLSTVAGGAFTVKEG